MFSWTHIHIRLLKYLFDPAEICICIIGMRGHYNALASHPGNSQEEDIVVILSTHRYFFWFENADDKELLKHYVRHFVSHGFIHWGVSKLEKKMKKRTTFFFKKNCFCVGGVKVDKFLFIFLPQHFMLN